MLIHDCTLLADGSVYSRRQHETTQLVPHAVEIFHDLLLTRGPAAYFASLSPLTSARERSRPR